MLRVLPPKFDWIPTPQGLCVKADQVQSVDFNAMLLAYWDYCIAKRHLTYKRSIIEGIIKDDSFEDFAKNTIGGI